MEDINKIVYVVDDDEIFHFIIRKMLGQQDDNLIVTSFLCAEEALEQLSAVPQPSLPSLIILDMNMDRMNGWDFIEAYRSIQPSLHNNIPIIMCSSSVDVRDLQKVEKTPELMAYITKPLDKNKMKVIEEYL
ncbi:Response regulator receiver domain-containing protein [Chitinophaga jiangningensis]|uniref:Response regulator receiver domain-containing protein n=1 Tax=Chitinophaga jiangningensis TaxID=1419482 RepID=A0A1M7MDG4_9BACT|nr:response regulator [Chitinophaga jiangningensis]SHM88872.1 Response regulator receiver domain-containing protein [Chitinophaga jiangningensis]